jgi:dTDP-glucose pyrophosphorylase
MTDGWKKTLVPSAGTVRDAIAAIDGTPFKIALIVGTAGALEGTVTDGDVRRAILKGAQLGDPVGRVMNTRPKSVAARDGRTAARSAMRRANVRQMPLVDAGGRVVGLELFDVADEAADTENWVVLMAGGTGSRLQPLTNDVPKPLLNVGGRPLIETIVENFVRQGFARIFLAVRYKSEMFEAHFGDGGRWGARIEYLREDETRGTAGALSRLPERPTGPLIVMNGDLLTSVDFRHLLDFHREHAAEATMCVREYSFVVPYGVVELDAHRIGAVSEKPVQRFFINAGIYALEPSVLDRVPPEARFDMTTLFESLISDRRETAAFPIREYWLDVGRLDDLERARGEYAQVFGG